MSEEKIYLGRGENVGSPEDIDILLNPISQRDRIDMEKKKKGEIFSVEMQTQTKVNVLELLYEIGDVDKENYRIAQRVGYVYRAELGKRLGYALLFSKEQLTLGEQKIYVRKGANFPGDYPIECVEHAHAVVEKNKRLQAIVNGKSKSLDIMQATCEALQDEGIEIYTVLQAVELEEIQKLTKKEIDCILEDYVCGGYEIAPELRSIMRAGLIHFPSNEENKDMMKYRPHALSIKATKSGFSTISERIGTNLCMLSLKSVEGYANSEGQITHSSFHNTWWHINVDEFLRMPEELFQHMLSFLEAGQYDSWKACRQITNYGAPRICFTANPQDMDGASFSNACESRSTKIEGQESLVDIGKQRLAFSAFKSALGKLTQVSAPAFSRLGVIIFSPSMPPAKKKDTRDSRYFDEVNGLARSIVYWLSLKNREIFDKNLAWLETPIKEYDLKLEKALGECNDQTIRNAWAGQKDAYKHVRGQALSEGIVDNAYEILQTKKIDKGLLERIREDSEENLKDVVAINLESLDNILLSAKEFDKDPGVIAAEINCSPRYLKPFLIAYAHLVKKTPANSVVRWDTPLLQEAFLEISKEDRIEKFGEEYMYWSGITRRMDIEKAKRITKRIFGKPVIRGEQLVIDSQIADLILSATKGVK